MRYIQILLFLFVLSCGCVTSPKEELLFGVWEGTVGDSQIVFKINQDRTCEITISKADSSLIMIAGDFEVDFSKLPIPLTIRNIPQLNHPLHTIIKFNGRDELKVAEFSPRWRVRPVSFDPNLSINLRRINKKY